MGFYKKGGRASRLCMMPGSRMPLLVDRLALPAGLVRGTRERARSEPEAVGAAVPRLVVDVAVCGRERALSLDERRPLVAVVRTAVGIPFVVRVDPETDLGTLPLGEGHLVPAAREGVQGTRDLEVSVVAELFRDRLARTSV